MDISKAYKVTEEATSGKWFDLGNGGRVRIAKSQNERHVSVLKRLRRPYKNMQTIPDDVVEQITTRAMAEAIFLDFEGIDEGGIPLLNSVENRTDVLTKYPDFKEQVASIATDHRNFLEEDEEGADSKN